MNKTILIVWRNLSQELMGNKYYSPPLNFERKTGLRGIHMPWIMPDNLSHQSTENYIRPYVNAIALSSNNPEIPPKEGAYQHLRNFFDKVVELNPSLALLTPFRKDPVKLANLAIGLTSQFNLTDLKHYLFKPYLDSVELASLDRRTNITAIRANAEINWWASHETLRAMRIKMDRSPAYKNIFVPAQNDPRFFNPEFAMLYVNYPDFRADVGELRRIRQRPQPLPKTRASAKIRDAKPMRELATRAMITSFARKLKVTPK